MNSHLCLRFINTAQKGQSILTFTAVYIIISPVSPYKNSMIKSLILCIVYKRIVFFSMYDILPALLHDYFNIVPFII